VRVAAWAFWKLVVSRRALLNRFGFGVPGRPSRWTCTSFPGAPVAAVVSLALSLVFLVLFWLAPLRIAPALARSRSS